MSASLNISAGQMLGALRARYAPPSYAFLPQVPNGTGAHKSRTADALAMSLWPSRGLELHGFEIKVSRGDWLRELKEPAKADAIAKYCDRWWIVAPSKEIVKPVELPKGWGLLCLRGSTLASAVEAALMESQPVSRAFLAGVLRVASGPGEKEIQNASDVAYKAGFEKGKLSGKRSDEVSVREETAARKAITDFEAASGLKIDQWNAGRIGVAVKFVMENRSRIERVRSDLRGLEMTSRRIHESIVSALEQEVKNGEETVQT